MIPAMKEGIVSDWAAVAQSAFFRGRAAAGDSRDPAGRLLLLAHYAGVRAIGSRHGPVLPPGEPGHRPDRRAHQHAHPAGRPGGQGNQLLRGPALRGLPVPRGARARLGAGRARAVERARGPGRGAVLPHPRRTGPCGFRRPGEAEGQHPRAFPLPRRRVHRAPGGQAGCRARVEPAGDQQGRKRRARLSYSQTGARPT